MMSLEEIVKHVEYVAYNNNDGALICMGIKEYRELAESLRELQERRKEPEIIRCAECKHRFTHNCVANVWVSVFGYTVNDDFYCGLAERRTDADD